MRQQDFQTANLPQVQTEPMGSWRLKVLEEKAQAAIKDYPSIAELQERLLALGGAAVAYGDAGEVGRGLVELLLKRGMAFAGDSRLYRGRRGGCHFNSARLWAASPEVRQLVTGFALSEDGCWRRHSWVLQPAKGKPPIIETTLKRLLYYGLVLTSEEAEQFWIAEKDNG